MSSAVALDVPQVVYQLAPNKRLKLFFSSRRRHTRSKRDWSSDVCSSDLASARPGSAQSWAWALNVATSASNPTASQGRPALQVTGEHREEPLEPPAPRGHAARADSARFATFAGSGPSTRSHRSRRGSVGATA